MKRLSLSLILAFTLLLAYAPHASAESADEQRASIQAMEANTLDKLYQVHPSAQNRVRDAAGYAVFSSADVAAIFFSGAYGHGLAHDNHSGKDTYMQMASAGVGLGVGVKDYRVVFVFKNKDTYNNFVENGLDLSGHADIAAKQGAKGGAIGGEQDILPGVRVYQLTRTGLMAQAMLRGTKYWRDSDLNNHEVQSWNDTGRNNAWRSRNNIE